MSEDFTRDWDMSPPAVAARVVDDWLDGTDQYEFELMKCLVFELATRLGNTAEIVYGDGALLQLAVAFREAADDMEMQHGERVGRGERNMKKLGRAA
jgi:hypothetical protein